MTDQPALAALLARSDLRRVLAALDHPDEETRIVGGAVRNALLARPVRDVDLATTALPQDTMRRAREAGLKAVPTGIDHGTVTVVVGGRPFEVTTLREDIATDGRHAVVRFGRDFAADALRRDFTINALSVDAAGAVQDYAGGIADLAARNVRFIGDPAERIREDYLRVLRFFRFSAEYGEGPLDRDGLTAAIRAREGLAGLSRERVRDETLKLFAAPRAIEIVGELADCGLATLLLGSTGERGRLGRAAAGDGLQRLAAFAVTIREDAERLRDALRLSNAETKLLSGYAALLAALKSRTEAIDVAETRRLVVAHGAEPLRDALVILDGEPTPSVDAAARAALDRFASGEEPVPVFPLRSADLAARGVPAGPAMGAALRRARRAWLAAGCPEQFDWTT